MSHGDLGAGAELPRESLGIVDAATAPGDEVLNNLLYDTSQLAIPTDRTHRALRAAAPLSLLQAGSCVADG